jgi:Winged helix DNA-binding domain
MPGTSPSSPAGARRGGGTRDVLSLRALNRATLERQLLLRRWSLPALEVVERLVGLQAQAPLPPYFGLWTRLTDFRPADLATLLTDRKVVRIALMRSTIHLVSGRDCRMLRPLVQPVLDRGVVGAYGAPLDGLDLAAIGAAGRALVEETPRTFRELGALLAKRWPGRDPTALAQAVRTAVPLVQVPPRGIWGASGPAAHTSSECWLGAPLDPRPSPAELVRRYLAAFGPASVLDVQKWSGLTRLGEVVAQLRPELRAFSDVQGRELFDLPDAPRPDPDVPAPVRFLAEYDNLLLSHADRTRVIADEHRPAIYTVNGVIPGSVLVDGFARGRWRIERVRGAATLRIRPFVRLPKSVRAALADEGARLLEFAAADAQTHDIAFAVPGIAKP